MPKNSQTPLLSFEDLRPYIKLLGKNWWMLLGLALVGYGAGRLVTHQLVDIHKATSELLINQKESTGVDAMMGARGVSRNFSYYNDEVQNQLRVLRSYDLVGRAIDKIADHVDCFYVGRVKETPAGQFGSLNVDVNIDGFAPGMTGRAIDLFVVDAKTCRLVLNATGPEVDQTTLEVPFGTRVTREGLDMTVTLNPDVASNADRLEGAKAQHFRIRVKNRDQRIGQYRGALQTTNVERTSVIAMTCTDVLPDRAKRFLDTLAATYIDYTAEARLATNIQTEKFINGQLEEINALTDTLSGRSITTGPKTRSSTSPASKTSTSTRLSTSSANCAKWKSRPNPLTSSALSSPPATAAPNSPLPVTSCSTTRGWLTRSASSWNSRPNGTPSCSTSSPALTKSGASTPRPSTCAATS